VDIQRLKIAARVKSFLYAVQGIVTVARTAPNAWYMALATVVTVAVGLWVGAGALEWCFLATAITLVWVTEIVNSAIEFLVDLASPELHPLAQKAKDAAAGAALLAVIFSIVIGILVLGPKLLAKLC
jgi:diacylglycerol kinase (ATP)